jgi:hypothetical protein
VLLVRRTRWRTNVRGGEIVADVLQGSQTAYFGCAVVRR